MLEMICRIADFRYKLVPEVDKLPLTEKIQLVLDDLLPMVDMKRKDVVLKVDEESESDDEY